MKVTIKGLQEAQQANLHNLNQLKPNGALGRMIKYATLAAHRHTVSITHVDTGTLKAAHRVKMYGKTGEVSIDPVAKNVRSGARASVYGVAEHNRGGSHAFYRRTVKERGYAIAREAAYGFTRELR